MKLISRRQSTVDGSNFIKHVPKWTRSSSYLQHFANYIAYINIYLHAIQYSLTHVHENKAAEQKEQKKKTEKNRKTEKVNVTFE